MGKIIDLVLMQFFALALFNGEQGINELSV